jgi:hypothetical protein
VTETSADRSVNDIEGRRVLSTVAADDVLAPVAAELQACAIAGCRIACWWRDDDAIADTPELRRLAATSEKLQLPLLLSVIPGQCETNLCEPLRGASGIAVAQHGFNHVNHEPAGELKSEFGPARPLSTVCAEICEGRERLHGIFGDGCLPIFVPPWNDLRRDAWEHLPGLTFRGLSGFGHAQHPDAAPGVALVNVHLEVTDWSARPVRLAPIEEIVEKTAALLRDRREGRSACDEPIGIMTHHRIMNEAAWECMDRLFSLLGAAAEWPSLPALFRLG